MKKSYAFADQNFIPGELLSTFCRPFKTNPRCCTVRTRFHFERKFTAHYPQHMVHVRRARKKRGTVALKVHVSEWEHAWSKPAQSVLPRAHLSICQTPPPSRREGPQEEGRSAWTGASWTGSADRRRHRARAVLESTRATKGSLID